MNRNYKQTNQILPIILREKLAAKAEARKEEREKIGTWLNKHRKNSSNVYGVDYTHYYWDFTTNDVAKLISGEALKEA